jgi:hypothetical protein
MCRNYWSWVLEQRYAHGEIAVCQYFEPLNRHVLSGLSDNIHLPFRGLGKFQSYHA